MHEQRTNERSTEPEDLDSAMKDAPGKQAGKAADPASKADGSGGAKSNPDDVKDGSAQDGRQPLAGA